MNYVPIMNLIYNGNSGGGVILINIKCNIIYESKNTSDISNIKISTLHGCFIPVFDVITSLASL
jgi:hypothetical protein